ncbi:MAG: hypothetical protein ABI462_13780 [Ignavibacteria bacterium]
MLEKRELRDGYAFRFLGEDKILDELMEFIKTERECCDFFTFRLTIAGDKSEAWLELTGTEGSKEFLKTELEKGINSSRTISPAAFQNLFFDSYGL